ncbi:Fc.00g056400.m01.CDS01 [Cosmosporella sp. VM-42]
MYTLQYQSNRLNALTKDVLNEKERKYQGFVKVKIEDLVFAPDDTSCDCNVNSEKVAQLGRIFETEGCNRTDPQNFILGEITQNVLQEAMELSNLTTENLRDRGEPCMLYLPPHAFIRCANGRSRAKAILDIGRFGRWWTIELYGELNRETFDTIAENYVNEGKFSHGHICERIVHHRAKDPVGEKRWWARLSKSKANILRRILKHPSLAPPILGIIQLIPGMRDGMEIGTWHKIISGKCDEEIVRYLEHILDIWTALMGSKEALQYVDPEDVWEFQLRVPGISRKDYHHLASLVMSGVAFKKLMDESEREKLLDRMKAIKYLIPSIHTLQKDFKYLRLCTDTLKRLILGKSKLPFTSQAIAYDAWLSQTPLGPDASFMANMKQLYLCIMRNIVELTGESPLLENREEAPENRHRDRRSWYWLAKRASQLGFHSAEITRLASENPDHEVALRALHDARPPSEYEYDDSQLQNLASSIVQEFRKVANRRSEYRDHSSVFTTTGVGEPISRRCGRQYSGAYAQDRWYFKVREFARPTLEATDITSLFVRKSVFHAFWRIDEDWDQDAMSYASPAPTPPRVESISQGQLIPDQETLIQQELARQYSTRQSATDHSTRDQQILDANRDQQMVDANRDQQMVDANRDQQMVDANRDQQMVDANRDQQEDHGQRLVVRQESIAEHESITSSQYGPGWGLIRPIADQAKMVLLMWDQNKWTNKGSYSRQSIEKEIEILERDHGELHILHPKGRSICKYDILKLPEDSVCISIDEPPSWAFDELDEL